MTYWDSLNNRVYIWRTDRKFRLSIEKLDEEDSHSWAVRMGWNHELMCVLRDGLTYREALRAIREESWRFPRLTPDQVLKKHFTEAELQEAGYGANEVPLKKLLKIASQIYGDNMTSLAGGRDAPIVMDDGTIRFTFYAGSPKQDFFERIPGVIAANGYELIEYQLRGSQSSWSIFIQFKIKPKEKK